MDSTKLNLTLSPLKWYKIRVKQIWSLSLFIHFLQNLPYFDWFWPTLIFSQDQVKLIISWWITMLYHKVRYGNGAWHHWHAIQIDKCCHRMCSHEICPLFYVCGPRSNNSGTSLKFISLCTVCYLTYLGTVFAEFIFLLRLDV